MGGWPDAFVEGELAGLALVCAFEDEFFVCL